MDQAKLRAWWWQRQGLDGRLTGHMAAGILERTGWARSVGGANPYLTLFARGGLRRGAVDAAVAALEIHELPGARGCTYVVPASDFALALKVGQSFGGGDMNTARTLGVTDREVDRLRAKVVGALANGPLQPEGLRDAVGAAARSLGEAGKKKGLTTTLPLALGSLQADGEIRRVPTNGRLDQQRYLYALWRPNPLAASSLSTEEAHVELARRYFSWIGPASAHEFRWFSGLGVRAATAAIAPLGLVPVEKGSSLVMFAEDLDAFHRIKPAPRPHYALVSSLDGISLLRRDLAGMLDSDDAHRKVLAGRGRCDLSGLAELPSHAILDRGRLVGLWEYDVESSSVASWAFGARDRALEAGVAATEAFVRGDLGDARSFSLDSPASRGGKIEALRQAAKR